MPRVSLTYVICHAILIGGLATSLRAEEPLVPVPPWAINTDRKPALERPLDSPAPPAQPPASAVEQVLFEKSADTPTGFTGRSGVLPSVIPGQGFVPMEDRWRIGLPEWDRYGKGHPRLDDYPYDEGTLWNPFKQNILKGDYPIIGQHTFLNITASSDTITEFRQIPTATTPFESTGAPGEEDFFGKPNQFLVQQNWSFAMDLFHGDAAFKPVDWRVKVTPVFNISYLGAEELSVVNPDPAQGYTRTRTFLSLEDWFVEVKLADLSSDYDFMSVRAGSQFFVSDFRGFIFDDTNRSVRLFGTRLSNRDQFNVFFADMLEKDTNSGLNTFSNRGQYVFIANYYRQDFLFPGFTMEASVHYDDDEPSFLFDKNDFLVRPDPVGVFQPHHVQAVYLGLAGDGHIDHYNISDAFYWAVGSDSMNPLANTQQRIDAKMAAVELSYDRDWVRFRTSFLYASGDDDPTGHKAGGFDSIMGEPNFAGGQFSFFQRQNLPLFGANLINRGSLFPDLRSSRTQGQANFVNPGLELYNIGVDFDLTPKLRLINNANFLTFDNTKTLETFLFQSNIHRAIGTDLSTGFEYRPLLSNNVVFTGGISALISAQGLQDIYNSFHNTVPPMVAVFLQMNLTF